MQAKNRQTNITKKKIAVVAVAVLLAASFVCTALIPQFWNRVFAFFGLGDFAAQADESPFSIHILDVGKADAILIRCGEQSMLVDAGLPESGEVVCRYLQKRGVQSLVYAVGTHPDNDHIGGMAQVLSAIPTKVLFTPTVPQGILVDKDAYDKMLAASDQTGQVHPKPGEQYALGEAQITVLGPRAVYEDTNNNSIVLMVTYGETRFLLMGDAETPAEMDLLKAGIDLKCDVLKVGHHGSKTSTCKAFLAAASPEYAAVSVGPDSNHLPDTSVLKTLREAGVQVCRTDLNGTLIFMSDGKTVTLKMEEEN